MFRDRKSKDFSVCFLVNFPYKFHMSNSLTKGTVFTSFFTLLRDYDTVKFTSNFCMIDETVKRNGGEDVSDSDEIKSGRRGLCS